MATQILIIHGQLPFAIKLKQTLERSAPFEAHPFTTVEAALDYLQDHIQDTAVVDFEMSDFPGDVIVRQLRTVQPNIVVIATPRLDPNRMGTLGVLASLDHNFAARDLINLVNSYFAQNERPSYTPPPTTALLARTKPMPETAAKPPGNPPEYSSLDDVIASAGGAEVFEAPLKEGDTPPSQMSDLVWAEETPKPLDSSFDDVLNALPPDAPQEAPPRNPFTDLVDSMRNEEQHRPFPSRQQQFVEYILTGGMDSLLEQIEQQQEVEDTPRQTPTTLFERLAQEEPPPPSFEESGTVSDLVTGVHDRSFRNVLSILRGEDVEEGDSESENVAPTPADFDVGPRERPETPAPRSVEEFNFDDEPTPAKVILQRTLEQSMSGGVFSLEELLANIEAQLPLHRPRVLPLPSWLSEQKQRTQDDAFLVSEPDFLPEQLPEDASSVEMSDDLYRDQPTQPARGQVIEANPEALETEWLENPQRSLSNTIPFPETLPEEIPPQPTIKHITPRPVSPAPTASSAPPVSAAPETPEEAPEEEETPVSAGQAIRPPLDLPEELPPEEETPQQTTGVWYNLPEEEFNTQFEMMAAFQVLGQDGTSSGALYTEVPVEPQPVEPPAAEVTPPVPASAPGGAVEDPYLAQLALSLTEVSLELTAEATLLARNQQIVAYAGQMPAEEIEELREVIADDWDAAANEVRIRFITAQQSGKDYMLYSRRTEDDFTLSLIFAGTTPLRDIRRQGQRLVNALASVPDVPIVAEAKLALATTPAPAPVDVSLMTPYACVWLLRDPRAHLDEATSQAIIAGLNIQMHEKQWNIQALQVHEDYVYMLADVPGEDPGYQIVRDLKRRSAEIAHALNPTYTPESLWSDSYLVVTPGRELDVEEIQQFINFDRME